MRQLKRFIVVINYLILGVLKGRGRAEKMA